MLVPYLRNKRPWDGFRDTYDGDISHPFEQVLAPDHEIEKFGENLFCRRRDGVRVRVGVGVRVRGWG